MPDQASAIAADIKDAHAFADNGAKPDVKPESTQKPSFGRIVIYTGEESNGGNDHPAIVTRVHSDDIVNLHVFFDGSPSGHRHSVPQGGSDAKTDAPGTWAWPKRS